MMHPGGSFILDPALDERMARKHCITQAKVQVQRINLCYYPGVNPSGSGTAIVPQLHQPTHSRSSIWDSSSPPFQLPVTVGMRLLESGRGGGLDGLEMGAGRGTKPWGWRWGSRLQRSGAAVGTIPCPAAGSLHLP